MYVGNTVRLKAEFKDLDGNAYDPNDVAVTIYAADMSVIVTASPTNDAVGSYYHDYTLTASDYAFEFSGVIPGTTFPVLSRLVISATSRV